MSLVGAPNLTYVGLKLPINPSTGQLYFDQNQGTFYVYNGHSWSPLTNADVEEPKPELIYDTGTVFGEEYLTIEPQRYNWKELEAWCTESFGLRGDMWENKVSARWYANSGKLWFRDRRDHDWFILKWSS